MKYYNLNNKTFVTTRNEQGLSNSETLFQYFQNAEIITGTYKGGHIKEGMIVGKQTAADEIELLYQCITTTNELKVGQSKGKISEDYDGKLLLTFEWTWLNGDLSGGFSYYRETER